jgi:poly(A) polymerase
MNKEYISTKLGGRVFTAAVPVVDNAVPTASESAFDASLQAFAAENIPLESKEGMQRRERVLNRMTDICREWIQSVCRQKGYPTTTTTTTTSSGMGGQLLTSGSYRLGVHEPGADIDTILVAPAVCHRSDFFGSNTTNPALIGGTVGEDFRDPNSLAERIRRHPDVTNFVPVEGAAVPLLTFDWEGINIDLLFARLNSNNIINTSNQQHNFDVDNDAVLDGADSATEKSLNGPRVTNLIAAFAGGTPERYQAFLTVVRCVRKWAKARGLYSNKMGYWGGVNINIGVALTVQLYPNACPASLLRKFFLVFCNWRWPQPVMLTKPHDAGYGLPVWSLAQAGRQVAPMITPAYPAMNSTLAVSRQTLQIMQEEFRRAHEIMDQLWRSFQAQPGVSLDWNKLFEPSDFFIAYPVRYSFILYLDFGVPHHCVVVVVCRIICFCWMGQSSATCRYALWVRRKLTHKLGPVLWNRDCESLYRKFWVDPFLSKRFSCGPKSFRPVWPTRPHPF